MMKIMLKINRKLVLLLWPTLLMAGSLAHAAQVVETVINLNDLLLAQNQPSNAGTGKLAPGLYVSVIDGAINLSNKGGSQNFSAGQFGFTANMRQPPVILPANPGIQFRPPPAFSSPSMVRGATTLNSANSKLVDCGVQATMNNEQCKSELK
jgi:hypothetical protein